ncbi:MAG: aromatic amino acid transport family protein [Patescibacteria group bacterium]
MAAMPREWVAFLLLVGTIVGAGMFAVPFVFQGAGFLTGVFVLIGLATAATCIHLAYAEVVVVTPEAHRLPGYVRGYLGRSLGILSSASYLFGLSGSLLAYVVLGGAFLGDLLRWLVPSLPSTAGYVAFYLFGVAVIARGIRFEGVANAVLTIALVLALVGLAFTLVPEISSANLHSSFQASRLFVPYGVILFALAGAAIIPDMRRVLGTGAPRRLRNLVLLGTVTAAVLYGLFALAVVGAMGGGTTPDAISGLAERFGDSYRVAGALIGFLATITSFITLGVVLEGTFRYDFGFRREAAWLATAIIPGLLILAGFHDFIAIVSVVGAVAIGFDSMLILALYGVLRSRGRPKVVSLPATACFFLAAVFGLGIIYELFRLFSQ